MWCPTGLKHPLCRNDTNKRRALTHKLASWWVTLPITESNAWLFACIQLISLSIQRCTAAERQRAECGESYTDLMSEREQCTALSQQKRSVLSRRYKDTNQAGIIFSFVSISGNFCECKAQQKLNSWCHVCCTQPHFLSVFTCTKRWFKVAAAVQWCNSSHPLVQSIICGWSRWSMTGWSESRGSCPTLVHVVWMLPAACVSMFCFYKQNAKRKLLSFLSRQVQDEFTCLKNKCLKKRISSPVRWTENIIDKNADGKWG